MKVKLMTFLFFLITPVLSSSNLDKNENNTMKQTKSSPQLTPEAHRRGEDQTYLTFPEWFLVYSPAEYANYIRTERPSTFPYFAHIGQFWQSYKAIYKRIKDDYPFNTEYHIMVMVIGISTTVEYTIKAIYELTFGRLSESLRANVLTEEDIYAAQVAQEYVDFIYLRPWYEFDFWGKLCGLWKNTSWFGSNNFRKWERKYALSSEYLVKAAYAWLLGLGTSASFDAPVHKTAVIIEKDTSLPLMLPRYQPFTEAALELAVGGENFVEIAGNKRNIVLSLWAHEDWKPTEIHATLLFKQAIITEPGKMRYVIELEIAKLGEGLRHIHTSEIKLEHIYDY